MTVEQLLKPRYKVIAESPGLSYKVGDMVKPHPWYGFDIFPFPDKYPHLFKKLEWWEERKESDMPEYVRNVADRKVFRVLDNEIMSRKSYTSKEIKVAEGVFTFYHSLSDCLPATKEEYLNQNKQ